MSNVTPKAVSTAIFATAAIGIAYRIATSSERSSRSDSPFDTMSSRKQGRRSAARHASEAEESASRNDGPQRPRKWAHEFSERGEKHVTEEPEDVEVHGQRSARRPRRSSVDPVSSVRKATRLENARKIRQKRVSPSPSQKSRKPALSPSRSPGLSRRSAENAFAEPSKSKRGERRAYTWGITFFVLSILLMLGVDKFHQRQRGELPLYITSVLFLEPLRRYGTIQADMERITSMVGEARVKSEGIAKLVPKCGWAEVGENVEPCGFANTVHTAKEELEKLKLGYPKALDSEVRKICNDFGALRRKVEKHAQDPRRVSAAVEKLAEQRHGQAEVCS